MTEPQIMKVVSPVAKPLDERVPLAPRLSALKGKRLGLLGNGKPKAMLLIERIAELLQERYELTEIVKEDRTRSSVLSPKQRELDSTDAVLDRLISSADVALNAIGD